MKLISWLLQTTSKGATYLQIITITAILIPLMTILIKEAKELFYDYIKEIENDKN